jgi:hypothetical protein
MDGTALPPIRPGARPGAAGEYAPMHTHTRAGGNLARRTPGGQRQAAGAGSTLTRDLPGSLRARTGDLSHATKIALLTSPVDPDVWMAAGGRLRMGSDGVPLKFSLAKARRAGHAGVVLPSLQDMGAPTGAAPSIGGPGARAARREEVKDGTRQQPAADRPLPAQLRLLAALVGADAVLTLAQA